MPFLSVQHGRIHYEVHGTGTDLVLLHGMWSNMGVWKRVLPSLSMIHRVLLVDQMGHGKSDRIRTPYRPDTHARDLHCLLDFLEVETSTLVGFSMGALVAQEYFFLSPSRVNALVLIATPPPCKLRWKAGIEIVSLLEKLGITSLKKESIKALRRRYAKNTDKDSIDKSLAELSAYSNREFSLILRSVWEGRNRRREREIRVPTLLVVGERDGIRSHSEHLNDTLPDSRFLTVPEADHSVVLKKPTFLVEMISAFQQEVASRTGGAQGKKEKIFTVW